MSDDTTTHQTGTPERVDAACDELNFPKPVRETAKRLYQDVYEQDLYQGRTLENILAGTVYIACREVGHACNPSRVAVALDTNRDELLSAGRHLMKRLNHQFQPIDPEPYVQNICEGLGLSAEFEATAISVLEACREDGIHSGKSPTGVAAGIVYATSTLEDETVTQSEISEVSDVSTVTIRNRYRKQLQCFKNVERVAESD